MLETLDSTIRIGSTPTFLYFDLYLYSAYTRKNADLFLPVVKYDHVLGCCIKSGFACSNICEQPLSIRQAVYNMLKQDWTFTIVI